MEPQDTSADSQAATTSAEPIQPESTPQQPTHNQTAPETGRTFTQADLDRIIASRIAPLKEKAEAYDKAQDAAKTEAQLATEKAAKLEAEVAAYRAAEARQKAAADAGLSPEWAKAVHGTTPEEIAQSVETLKGLAATQTGQKPAVQATPKSTLGQGPGTPSVSSVTSEREKYALKYKKS